MVKKKSASRFHKKILIWYSHNRRRLPWRNTSNPYRILLSEIMAQQTQVGRVSEFYTKWIKNFPTFSSVAEAPAADILRAWSGLGYNSRALRFHLLAKTVAHEFHSRLPDDTDNLQRLPGIGRYTAHAVACFAFGKKVPVVDVNIKRILTRWTRNVRSVSEQLDENPAWEVARQFLPVRNVDQWNQSLMDFGALICTARHPKCNDCPVSGYCPSAFSKTFLLNKKKAITKEPSWRGIPRRIYRGKILKLLHHHAYSSQELSFMLWGEHSSRDLRWIETLLAKMKGERLLSSVNGGYSLVQ